MIDSVEKGYSEIERFLISVERQALLLVKFALKNDVEAFDLLENFIGRWVKKNKATPSVQWRQAFFHDLIAATFLASRRQIATHHGSQSHKENQFFLEVRERGDTSGDMHGFVLTTIARLPLPPMLTFILCDWLSFSIKEASLIFNEQASVIENRLASVRMGLLRSMRDNSSDANAIEDVPLLQKMMRAIDGAIAATDYVEFHQLRAIRHAALRGANASSLKMWIVLAIIMMSLFIFWWLNLPQTQQKPITFYSGESLLDAIPQAWQEDAELLENIAFYEWLAKNAPVENAVIEQDEMKGVGQEQWRDYPDERKVAILENYQSFLRLSIEKQKRIRAAYYYFQQQAEVEQENLRKLWREIHNPAFQEKPRAVK